MRISGRAMSKLTARAGKRLAYLLAVLGCCWREPCFSTGRAGPASGLQASLQPGEAGGLAARDAGPTAEWVGSTPKPAAVLNQGKTWLL